MDAGSTTSSSARRAPVMMSVAQRAGVSQKTVSRVINNEPNVSEELRGRVLTAIDELGYRPNTIARALVTRRTRLIALIADESPLFGPSSTIMSVSRAVHDAGYALSIATAGAEKEQEIADAVSRMIGSGAEGLVLFVPIFSQTLDEALRSHTPTIVLGDIDSPLCPKASHTERQGAFEATKYLLDLGHRTVHHIAGPAGWQCTPVRTAGWQTALESAGAHIPPPLVGDWTAQTGYHLGRQLIQNPAVTAVFAANDQMAMGLVRACAEAGRRVPQDISIVGFDDEPASAYQVVPLTTVRLQFAEAARAAVTSLINAIEGHSDGPSNVEVPTRLIVRESTGPPPTRY